jgi:ABC-type antimicrobial peptide transport system ATPase subunit
MPKKGEKPTEKQLAALEAGRRKLVSGDEWSKEQQAKSIVARVENQEKEYDRKTFAQCIGEQLDLVREDGTTRRSTIAKNLVKMLDTELAKTKPNGKVVNQIFQAIRDTIGEKPQEKVSVEQEKPFEIEIKVTGGSGGNNNNA